jgi:tryptophan-rich sensory protein
MWKAALKKYQMHTNETLVTLDIRLMSTIYKVLIALKVMKQHTNLQDPSFIPPPQVIHVVHKVLQVLKIGQWPL